MKSGRARRGSAAAAFALAWADVASAYEPVAPLEHRRGVEQTFLTFPEWFLVHSPAEYAEYVKAHPPSGFPFWAHIGQFWRSYSAVTRATRSAGLPLNAGYHVMIVVIGVSTTVEYALRSAWETVPGRLAELTARGVRTPEDEYSARLAQEYVDFIRVKPWYEFDFARALGGLWRERFTGPGLLRKCERKYFLTTEYGVKAIYGWVIRKATKSAYEEPIPVTSIVLDRVPEGGPKDTAGVAMLTRLPDGAVLVTVPRYEAFLSSVLALARSGASFREIAGNGPRAPILLSVLAPSTWQPPLPDAHVLFVQPIITRPPLERFAFTVPVGSLADLLRRLDQAKTTIEHVYDF